MMLHTDDDGFVRAEAPSVYRVLTDVEAWPTFWPGTSVQAVGDDRFLLRSGGRRRLRIEATAHGWRHDTGFHLAYDGDLRGDAEFWLEPGWGGTVVHHLLHAEARRAPARTLAAYRRWLRRGLWGLKDQLQAVERQRRGLSL